MSTTTPNLTLTLYDSTTDQVVTFATFRAVWGGTATTSNFYRIDTWAGTVNSSITTLQNQRGAITVSASYVSANYYEATVASITSYITGMTILLKLDTDSAGTVTLNINALGTKSVTKVNSSGSIVNIAGGELQSNRYYMFTYDGTQWVWVNADSADQVYHGGTSGNIVLVASDGSISDSSAPATVVGSAVYNATAKTTLANADTIGITDSAASNVLKKITWSNFQTAIGTALGSIINALTGKTTPVGADVIAIGDSASSFASKLVLLSNLYKALGTGTQDSTTFLRGDGTYAIPAGGGSSSTIQTRYIITPSISSNNLVFAIKYIDGNDPTSTNKLTFRVGNTEYDLTSSLSFTKNAGTAWMNMSSTELQGKNVDLFAYAIGETGGSAGLKFGYSRIPYATTMGDFVNTTTDEKYIAGNWTNFNSTDSVTNIGRFRAQLSSGNNWSIPSSSVINYPIMVSDILTWQPVFSANGSMTYTSVTTSLAEYTVDGRSMKIESVVFGTTGGSSSTAIRQTLPFKAKNYSLLVSGTGWTADGSGTIAGALFMDSTTANLLSCRKYDGTNYGLGVNRYIAFNGSFYI